ncbi:MAG: hypothetical protein C4551_05415 [Bacillota bacterium]|jgi:hypothetical protein|nr:MAG: hypothetical protein C4551_05415 [Bacillota bacterium]
MAAKTGVVVFEGGGRDWPPPSPGDPRALLAEVRHWVTLDTLEKFLARPEVGVAVLATDSDRLRTDATRSGAEIYATGPGFHFGRVLSEVTTAYGLDRLIFLGGGSVPLLTPPELDFVVATTVAGGPLFVTNNVQSPDIIGLGDARAVAALSELKTDNAALLALVESGLKRVLLPETATTSFDLDTPSDVLFLAHEVRRIMRSRVPSTDPWGLGPRCRAGLASTEVDVSAIERAASVLARGDYPSVTLVGRVSGTMMCYLNANFLVRLRVFSEERGMKALGRIERNEVRSLLGSVAEGLGVERLVSLLSTLSDAVFWDTRVIMAHLARWPDEADRFESDLGRWARVRDPQLRRLGRAVSKADRPFVLGGHSVVSGGLRLLARGLLQDCSEPRAGLSDKTAPGEQPFPQHGRPSSPQEDNPGA